MLEFLRNHVSGFVGFALIGALVFAFALSFGQQSAGWGQGEEEYVAATVEGMTISEATFTCAFNLLGGRSVSSNTAEWQELRKATIDGLIERQLLLNLAQRSGISASTEEAEENVIDSKLFLSTPIETHAQRLQSIFYIDAAMASRELLDGAYKVRQSFKDEDGKLQYEQLQKYIRHHLQITEEAFVEEQRKELVAQRMRRLLVSGVRVSEQEVRDQYDRENDTATISYIRLFPTYFSDRLDPTPEEMQAWIAANGEAIEQYYETNKYKYTNLEKMARARHILIGVAEDATDEEKAKARGEIEALAARIKAGESFADLARQYSEDPGSGAKGGDLGYSPRGRMVPEFDDVMFALEPGKVSDIVETKFGFHIIKLEGMREGNISLEEATEEIADQLYREAEGKSRALLAANDYLARLKSGESIDGLLPPEEENAGPLKLRVNTSSPFSRNAGSIPGIGNAPEIIKAAFELSPDSPVPAKTFDVRGDQFVFVLKDRVVPDDDDFKTKRDKMLEDLLSIKQATWLRDRIREIRGRAEKAGEIVNSVSTVSPSGEAPDMADEKGLGDNVVDKEDDKDQAEEPEADVEDRSSKKKTEPSAPAETPSDDGEEGEEE